MKGRLLGKAWKVIDNNLIERVVIWASKDGIFFGARSTFIVS